MQFQNFKDINISTKTMIIESNLKMNIEQIFAILPLTPYVIPKRKRGRRKKTEQIQPIQKVENGSITYIGLKTKERGVQPKKNKKQFRNAITIVIYVDKFLNVKLSSNGKFQMTGCRSIKQCQLCIKYIMEYLDNTLDKPYIIQNNNISKLYPTISDKPIFIFTTVMSNKDFKLGFLVNREALDRFINERTSYNSIFETSFGYTGVNIKLPNRPAPVKLPVFIKDNNNWSENRISYQTYLKSSPTLLKKELAKTRYNTFLVFQSGSVIMSGLYPEFMEDAYNDFIKLIKGNKQLIEEKLTVAAQSQYC